MRVVVVTVFAPRPEHPRFIDYLPLLRAQRDSATRMGHDHLVVTDADLGGEFRELRTRLPAQLMPAMLVGALVWLRTGTGGAHTVLVDADCLVTDNLEGAFKDYWDLGLTRRSSEVSPINNGAMYVNAFGVGPAIEFFERALGLCGEHWGADQEAISAAAAPVPAEPCVEVRDGCRIAFLDMKKYGAVPKKQGAEHRAYIVHFKGDKKAWMLDYARQLLL